MSNERICHNLFMYDVLSGNVEIYDKGFDRKVFVNHADLADVALALLRRLNEAEFEEAKVRVEFLRVKGAT